MYHCASMSQAWSQIIGLPLPGAPGEGWLRDDRERVRFVLRARLHEAGVSQSKVSQLLTLRGRPVTRSRLSRLLTSGDVLADDLDLVRQLERLAIHNAATSTYATRIIEWKDLDARGDVRWWLSEYSKFERYERPLDAIIAGLSLVKWVEAVGPEYAREHAESLPAREALAVALCRIASGSYGYAHDSITIIARLGPVISEFVADFIEKSPLGVWVARAADGAIRRARVPMDRRDSDPMLSAYSAASARMKVDYELPSRCISHIRLYRRLAIDGSPSQQKDAFERLIDIAREPGNPTRWGRFALWVCAEPAVRDRERFAVPFEKLCAEILDNASTAVASPETERFDVLADVAEQLLAKVIPDGSSGHRLGRYHQWAGEHPLQFDLTNIDHRGEQGAFDWPLTRYPATDALLRKYTLRGYDGRLPRLVMSDLVADVGPDIRVRLLDVLHELLIHPGFIRVQTYMDLLHASGDRVFGSVVNIVAQMLDEVLSANDDRAYIHHLPSTLDAMLFLLGRARLAEGIPILLRAAHGFSSRPELVASAIWSIGDVAARGVLGREGASMAREVRDTLDLFLRSPHLSVQRAAIHAASVTGIKTTNLEWQIETLARNGGAEAFDWANWCMLMSQSNALATPPIDFAAVEERWESQVAASARAD